MPKTKEQLVAGTLRLEKVAHFRKPVQGEELDRLLTQLQEQLPLLSANPKLEPRLEQLSRNLTRRNQMVLNADRIMKGELLGASSESAWDSVDRLDEDLLGEITVLLLTARRPT